jgi:dienelactone hydrolase
MRYALPTVGMIVVLVHIAVLKPFAAGAQNAAASRQEAASTTANVGQYFPFLQKRAEQQRGSLSYLAKEWPNADEWRRQGREKMRALLAYDPPAGPSVDPQRVGCMGLSIGGFRAAHLTGLDSRIKAAVVAGWMTTYDSLLKDHLRAHTWMIYVPGQLPFLDLPDVASMNAPSPLLIANCSEDALFPLSGMQNAEAQLRAVYTKLHHPDRFECRYYDLPHSLTIPMQNDAIDWLERWLKPEKEQQQ